MRKIPKRVEEPCPMDKNPLEYFGRRPGNATFIIIMKINQVPHLFELANDLCHENFMTGDFNMEVLQNNFMMLFDEELALMCNYYLTYDFRNWETIARYFMGKTCLSPQFGWYDAWMDNFNFKRKEEVIARGGNWWD